MESNTLDLGISQKREEVGRIELTEDITDLGQIKVTSLVPFFKEIFKV
jgi:hypothetical protein